MSPHQIEADLYRNRPDLWGLSKALKLAPEYRRDLMNLLSRADKAALKEYSDAMRAARMEKCA